MKRSLFQLMEYWIVESCKCATWNISYQMFKGKKIFFKSINSLIQSILRQNILSFLYVLIVIMLPGWIRELIDLKKTIVEKIIRGSENHYHYPRFYSHISYIPPGFNYTKKFNMQIKLNLWLFILKMIKTCNQFRYFPGYFACIFW